MSINRRQFLAASACACAAPLLRGDTYPAEPVYDVCIYGGTAAGVAAAIAAADAGGSVIVIEPSRWLGGMSGGGLNAIDWGNRRAVGALAQRLLIPGDDVAMRALYRRELSARGIPVVFEHRLGSVSREDGRIVRIDLDAAPPDRSGCPAPVPLKRSVRPVSAHIFIDCSYEGDLMAQAGVPYTWGRESREAYGESLAGIRPVLIRYDIDPYVRPGEPSSGLLPLLQDLPMGPLGAADRLTMMYAFRWVLTDRDPIRIDKPEGYDPRTYEIFRRGFARGIDLRAARKMSVLGTYTDYRGSGIFGGNSSRSLWAQSVAGANADYPDGDWKTRAAIWRGQMDFVRGMYHFLRTDPSAPADLREKAETIGFQRGIFDETGGWPHQLYVREARRMRSDYVVTQRDLEGATQPHDSVGLGSYGVDDWPYATVAHEGGVALSGGEFSILKANPEGDGVHAIPYRSIIPARGACRNLLVPVCCSASHIAMTSIRMEPVWITLGQSAGIAAMHAIRQRVPVQEVDVPRLRSALRAAGQVLDWSADIEAGWASREAWNRDKAGYEWLFDVIDRDADGCITPDEYRAFQDYKRIHADWSERIKREWRVR